MLLDDAWRLAFRQFSTLFLIVAVVTIPLHLGYSFTFRNAIAVREFHTAIERFPEYRKVRGVGPTELRTARLAYVSLNVVELLLLPLAVGAAARVAAVDRQAGIPTVTDSWSASVRQLRALGHPARGLLAVAVAAVVAVSIGLLVQRIGLLVAATMSPDVAFVPVGVVEALARAVGAPFFLAPAATALTAKGVATVAPTN